MLSARFPLHHDFPPQDKEETVVDLSKKLEVLAEPPYARNQNDEGCSVFYSNFLLEACPKPGTITMATQTDNCHFESVKDRMEGYKEKNSFLNNEIMELNAILKQRSDREQKLIS